MAFKMKQVEPVKTGLGWDRLLLVVLALLAGWILWQYAVPSEPEEDDPLEILRAELARVDAEIDRAEDVRRYRLERAESERDRKVKYAEAALENVDEDSELGQSLTQKNQDQVFEVESRYEQLVKTIEADFQSMAAPLWEQRENLEKQIADLE